MLYIIVVVKLEAIRKRILVKGESVQHVLRVMVG